ncbi:MAG: histidinol-phosphatase [Opitutales bacterium]|nr:histidinol-phosphatase [Opitutales bacterium]
MSKYSEYMEFAKILAMKSGTLINSYFGEKNISTEWKADETPVTVADREAESLIRRLIKNRYPKHGIIGEEFGNENEDADYVWIIDPIDGTKTFTAGVPLFGTVVCLKYKDQPIVGMVHQPVLNKLLIGDGETTWLNDQVVTVRKTQKLEDAILLTTDPLNPGRYKGEARWNKFVQKVKLYRTWGDCYGYMMLASGWADIMIDPIVAPWDFMAMLPIIKGAGGAITDWEGNDPSCGGNSIIASNKVLHRKVVEFLND